MFVGLIGEAIGFLFQMKQLTNKMRTRLKIVAATTTAVFSLATVFTATYAWFVSNSSVSATGMQISVKVSGTAELASLNLIKFDYKSETIGTMEVFDYLDPSTGTVNEYYYNKEYNDGAGSFGYDDNGNFVAVNSTMNVYDPVDRIIRGGDLSGLNCNAIYEVSFTSDMETSYLQLFANLLTDKIPGNNQILLSDCADFDVYYEDDFDICDDTYSDSSTYAVGDFTIYNGFIYVCNTAIASGESFDSSKWDDIPFYSKESTYSAGSYVFYGSSVYQSVAAVSNPESFSKAKWAPIETYSTSTAYAVGDFVFHNGHPYICIEAASAGTFNSSKWDALLCEKIYYPTYKTTTLSSSEEKYYKLSYLSSLESDHSHFYGSSSKPERITLDRDHLTEFANINDERKVYINVNYAPSQADVYIREIYNTIRAIYDFTFDFHFTGSPEVGD